MTASRSSSIVWDRASGSMTCLGAMTFLLLTMGSCRRPGSRDSRENVQKDMISRTSHSESSSRSFSGLGTVVAYNSVVIRTRVDGQIEQVHFREGDIVKRGDLLFALDQRPYLATLREAEADRASDYSKMEDARATFLRDKALFTSGIISRQQFDTQEATYHQLQAATDADDARIESDNVQLSYTRIVAPITGRIGLRQIDEGNVVRASDSDGLATIMQINPISVIFTLPAKEVPIVLRSMEHATVTAEAFSDDNRTQLARGTVLTVDDAIDISTGLAKLKATFDNKGRRLWPNQYVNVRLTLPDNSSRPVGLAKPSDKP